MTVTVPEISVEKIKELVHELDTKGFTWLPNYVEDDALARMQMFVASAVDRSSQEYIHFKGPESLCGSGLDQLSSSPSFVKLMYDLFEHGTGKPAMKQEFYQVLRCLTGNSGRKHSMIFHYDSYVVTALIPIQIPSQGRSGDLLIYPNTRKLRSTYLFNVIDKILLGNPLTQKILRTCVGIKKLSPAHIKMVPGNLYLFWGYRSIHTNEPCDPDKVRATALFHYGNPHSRNLREQRTK
jgi:hypothetical protein